MRSMFFFLFVFLFVPWGWGNWLADTCAFVQVPLIVINTLVIVYELVLG